MRRGFGIVCLALGLLALALLAGGAQADWQDPATLRRNDVSLHEAVDLICSQVHEQYVIEPGIPRVRVTLNVQELPFSVALRTVIRQAALEVPGLTMKRDGLLCIVTRKPDPGLPGNVAPDPRPGLKVTVTLEKVPLRQAAGRLFRGSGLELNVGETVRDVPITLRVRKTPLRSATLRLVRQVAAEVPNLMTEFSAPAFPDGHWRLWVWEPAKQTFLPDDSIVTVAGLFYGKRRRARWVGKAGADGGEDALTIWTTRTGGLRLGSLFLTVVDGTGREYRPDRHGRGGTGPPPEEEKDEWIVSPPPPLGGPLRLRFALGTVTLSEPVDVTIPYTNEWREHQLTGWSLDRLMAEAADRGELDIIRILLQKGACVYVAGLFDTTPLEAAAWRGDVELARELLDRGAPVDARAGMDPTGRTALYCAITSKSADVVELLLSRGADPNLRVFFDPPVVWAAFWGDIRSVQLLLTHGAKVNARGSGGKTALSMARARGRTDVVRLLKQAGARDEGSGRAMLQNAGRITREPNALHGK